MYVMIFSAILSKKLLILIIIQRGIIKNVRRSSRKIPAILFIF